LKRFEYIEDAIESKKEIKCWVLHKKEKLIDEFNPKWRFLCRIHRAIKVAKYNRTPAFNLFIF
jgi:predicted GIY-YIG superfamily endonuclease